MLLGYGHCGRLARKCFSVALRKFSRMLLARRSGDVFFFSRSLRVSLNKCKGKCTLTGVQRLLRRGKVNGTLIGFKGDSILTINARPYNRC